LHVATQATRRDSWRPGFGALEPVDDYSHLMGFKHQHVGTEVDITDKCWLVDFFDLLGFTVNKSSGITLPSLSLYIYIYISGLS
jgi:hypothetical protein